MPCSSDQADFSSQIIFSAAAENTPASGGLKKISLPVPTEIGKGEASFVSLNKDLGYGTLCVPDAADSNRVVVRASDTYMKFTLHLSRRPSVFSVDGFSGRLNVRQWDGYLLSAPAYGIIDMQPGEQLEEFSLFITEELFWRLSNELQISWTGDLRKILLNLAADRAFLPAPTQMHSRLAVFQLLHCPLGGSLLRLYIEAKLMEIFALRVHEFLQFQDAPVPSVRLSQFDRRHLEEAREILEREAFDPPCICELAGRVGLNSTKLKQGFRRQYGTTIFTYVRQLRMEKALELLSDGALGVGGVALAVGYSSFSSFSKAFFRYYGFLPKEITRYTGT